MPALYPTVPRSAIREGTGLSGPPTAPYPMRESIYPASKLEMNSFAMEKKLTNLPSTLDGGNYVSSLPETSNKEVKEASEEPSWAARALALEQRTKSKENKK